MQTVSFSPTSNVVMMDAGELGSPSTRAFAAHKVDSESHQLSISTLNLTMVKTEGYIVITVPGEDSRTSQKTCKELLDMLWQYKRLDRFMALI